MATSNLRKAAILLSSLPDPQAEKLLAQLNAEQSATVFAEMAALREVDRAERETVARAFAGQRILHIHPAHARWPSPPPFEFLHDLDVDDLLGILADENPQAIALVLFYLPAQQAADVLARLTAEQQFSVVCRIATFHEPDPEVVRDVEEGLARRLAGGSARPSAPRGITRVVQLLNAMEPASERRLLAELAEADPPLVHEIRRVMFGPDVAECGAWDPAAAMSDEGDLDSMANA
jgi:flagellar motor switch protein FliG